MSSLDFAMRAKELDFFAGNLQKKISHFHRNDLPWRKNRTPYAVWVSEIMLQQTQVNRVVEYYLRFMNRFPDIQILSMAKWEDFLPYYQGLGYYHRGRNMLETAKKIVKHYHLQLSKQYQDILSKIDDFETDHSTIIYGKQKELFDHKTKLEKEILELESNLT